MLFMLLLFLTNVLAALINTAGLFGLQSRLFIDFNLILGYFFAFLQRLSCLLFSLFWNRLNNLLL